MHLLVEDESLCCHVILVFLKLLGGTAFEAGLALVQIVFNELELALRMKNNISSHRTYPLIRLNCHALIPQIPLVSTDGFTLSGQNSLLLQQQFVPKYQYHSTSRANVSQRTRTQ
jgi:hypothetical protein